MEQKLLGAVWIPNKKLAREYALKLLEAGANVNAADGLDRTPLWWAATLGRLSIIRVLLASGAQLELADRHLGRTALHQAVDANCDCQTLDLLIDAGANLEAADVNGVTPLMYAARLGKEQAVCKLLGAGANVNATSIRGDTALKRAARRGSVSIMQALIAAGADVPQGSFEGAGGFGFTPLLAAAAWTKRRSLIGLRQHFLDDPS